MTNTLSKPAEDALATFRHHDGLARLNARRAEEAMDIFLSLLSGTSDGTGTSRVPNCVLVWRNWLADNGPALRQTIADATGVKFNERGTRHTVKWSEGYDDEGSVAPDTITKFLGQRRADGRGAPPTIYALWSQRYDVLPLFGVGPERPDQSNEPEAMTGVIRPPVSSHPIDPDHGEEQFLEWDEATETVTEGQGPIVTETPEEWAARVIAMRDGEPAND